MFGGVGLDIAVRVADIDLIDLEHPGQFAIAAFVVLEPGAERIGEVPAEIFDPSPQLFCQGNRVRRHDDLLDIAGIAVAFVLHLDAPHAEGAQLVPQFVRSPKIAAALRPDPRGQKRVDGPGQRLRVAGRHQQAFDAQLLTEPPGVQRGRAAEGPAALDWAKQQKGPVMLEVDMASAGDFASSFAGPLSCA